MHANIWLSRQDHYIGSHNTWKLFSFHRKHQREALALFSSLPISPIVTFGKWWNRWSSVLFVRNRDLLLLLPDSFSVWTGNWKGLHFLSALPRWKSGGRRCRVPRVLQQWTEQKWNLVWRAHDFGSGWVILDLWYWKMDDVSESGRHKERANRSIMS